MPRYIQQGWWFDGNGKIVKEGTVTVYLAGTSTLASIYTASSGGFSTNSVTSSTTDGSWSFYVDTSDYSRTQRFKITFSKSGFTSKTIDDVIIFPFMHNGCVYPEDYGAVGDGTTDDTDAIEEAGNTLQHVVLDAKTYKITRQLDVTGWYMTGQGWQSSAGTRTLLAFSGLGTDAAMITRTATNGRRAILENFFMYGNSWASGTGCEGYGMDIEQTVTVRNVYVYGFKLSGIFTHNNAAGDGGPYDSLFENVRSDYNGAHGFLVGTGSNAMTFINCSGKWNGAPSYGTAPSVAGSGDGFHLEYANEGNPGASYNSYVTEGIKIVGGDCSYNSRYGWNFVDGAYGDYSPSYAEGNLQATPGQVSIGDVTYCFIRLGAVTSAATEVNFAADYADYLETNSIFVSGKHYGSGNSNTSTSRYNFINANLNTILAYTDGSNYVSLAPNSGGHLNINRQGTPQILITGLDTYADNAAAVAGGLTAGMLYKTTTTGVLAVVV